MSSAALIEQAKQGDVDAIASLINQSLNPKGITVQANLSRNFLTLITESDTIPDQKTVTQILQKGIQTLNPQGVERIIIKGKARNQSGSAWRAVIDLTPPGPSPRQPQVQRWLKDGKIQPAIAWLRDTHTLLNTALLAGILLALLGGSRNPGSNKAHWEYTVEGIQDERFEITMQEFGAEGWELASARRAVTGSGDTSTGLYEVILRRPITASQARRNIKAAEAAWVALEIESSEGVARVRLNGALQAQRLHRLVNDAFATSFEELDLSDDDDDDDYTYTLTVINDRSVQVTAVAKQRGHRSYIGAVFIAGSQTKTILCGTESASQEAPPMLTLAGLEPQCAEGSGSVF